MRYMRWNKERLIEQYMDKQEEVLEKAGLGSDIATPPRLEVIDGFMCEICCDGCIVTTDFAHEPVDNF